MRVMTEPGTEFISFFQLQEPYTSVQFVDRPIATILGSALHQRLCQQGLFRRRPMTGCNVAGVFGQNGAIQTGAGGRDREASRGVGKRKRKAGKTQTRQSWEEHGQTDGGGGGAGKALTDRDGGLLTVQEYCLKSICHLGAVEPVITMWYPLFHSDNLFSAFSVRLTARHKGRFNYVWLPTWLSGSGLINCPRWAIQSANLRSNQEAADWHWRFAARTSGTPCSIVSC